MPPSSRTILWSTSSVVLLCLISTLWPRVHAEELDQRWPTAVATGFHSHHSESRGEEEALQRSARRAPSSSRSHHRKPTQPTSDITPIILNMTFNSNFLDETHVPSSERTLSKLVGVDLVQLVEEATGKVRKRLEVIEPNIHKNNAMQKPGSIGWFVSASLKTTNAAKNSSRSALIAEEASRAIVKRHKLNLDQIVFGLTNLDTRGTSLWRECPRPVSALTCYPGRYRSYSGHCNNVEHPEWGSAHMPYRRSLAPRYADGIVRPRRSMAGNELPSARDVSLTMHQGKESSFSHMTTLTSFFGEFIFHDLSHTPQSVGYRNQRIRCCGIKQSDLIHPECYPVKIANKDPLMGKLNQDCMEYVRSSPAIRNHCGLGPREQINQVSSYLDGSVLYGSSKPRAQTLRSGQKGQLKAIRVNKKGKEVLPIQEDGSQDCKIAGNKKCFKSGDDRVNENLGLAIIHTLFLREHNRIARQLSMLNPHWTDNELFEESRKIVSAQIQHITYSEFLPYVLGEETIDRYNLRLLNEDFYHGYDMSVDATVHNAVANAVFAFLFTTMPSTMERYSEDLNMLGHIKMTESYFNPSEMYSNKFDQYLMGMISQNAKSSDPFVTDEMTNGLSEEAKEVFDFVAFAIQRGRDHGLPGYVEYRRACRIEPNIDRFEDLATVVRSDVLKRLATLYKNVRDIDLFTGGLVEKPLKGALVGPTFACLLGRQFNVLRRGDRFWYENDMPPSSFTKEQLQEIRKTSLARILCDNGDQTNFVQPQAMIASDIFLNAFQYCSTTIIPKVDLSQWKSKTSPFGASFATISSELVRSELNRAKREADDLHEFERAMPRKVVPESVLMHYRTTRAKRQAIAINNQSLVLEKATHGILRHLRNGRDRESSNDIVNDIHQLVFSLPQVELGEFLKNQLLVQNQQVSDNCDESDLPCDHTSPFRTITGWCNNLAHPEFGKSFSLFNRFLPPIYEDGVSSPRRSSVVPKRSLPSPRLVSTTVHEDIHAPHLRYTLAIMQWGQFIDHDLTFTPMYLTSSGHLLDCKSCNSRKTVHPECWPIPIPKNDPFFATKNGPKCLHFVRSMNAQKTLGPREQMNQLTSYLDASMIYGSDVCQAHKLRTFQQGKLNSTRHPLRNLKDLLPQTTQNVECKAPSGFCFEAGDARSSEQPSLACLHTIFMREHNRMADRLSQINPHWSDERIYQITRKIISALVQQITYGEFLPRLLGKEYLVRYGLALVPSGYYEEYDATCDATLKNEFAAAVYRLGHTLLKPSFERLDINFKTIKEPLKLREAFFNSDMLYEPYAIDELLRGIVTSSIEKFDNSITEEVTNHLFEERKKPFSGMDLISLNLQRARDHGLQTYNEYRALCNLTKVKNFNDLRNEIVPKVIDRLKSVYEHVDDIDLFSGGVAETPLHGALVGPTFGCLLGMQFSALRKCDRFWYENSDRFTRFTPEQLAELRKVTLAKLICTNADAIPQIQKQSMDQPDPFLNPRISCNALPEMNLNKWKDFERSCMARNKVVPMGRHRRISPCINCVCTLEGLVCQSVRVDNCRELSLHYSRDEILADQSCMVQCAYAIRNNQIHSTSMRSIMSMLNIGP